MSDEWNEKAQKDAFQKILSDPKLKREDPILQAEHFRLAIKAGMLKPVKMPDGTIRYQGFIDGKPVDVTDKAANPEYIAHRQARLKREFSMNPFVRGKCGEAGATCSVLLAYGLRACGNCPLKHFHLPITRGVHIQKLNRA